MQISYVSVSVVVALFSLLATLAVARPTMYIFGDIHYDPFYGTASAVDKNGVCTTSSSPTYGTKECDSPKILVQSAIEDIFTQSKVDGDGIMLITGDFVRHKLKDVKEPGSSSDATLDEQYELVYNITNEIAGLITHYQKQSGIKAVVLHPNAFAAVDGNEDCVPHYNFYTSLEPTLHPALMRVTEALKDNGLMTAEQAATFGRCAFYAVTPADTNLLILNINTVIYSVQHVPVTTNESDPCGQFTWLKEQLSAARTNGTQRVMILGHIIPDATKWPAPYLDAYRTIVMDYHDIITAQWFGHTHMFTFLTLSENTAPLLFDVPGITPRDGNMPAYLKVTFTDQEEQSSLSSSQWVVDEITERFLDITTTSLSPAWQDGQSFPGSFSKHLTSPLNTSQLYQYGTYLLGKKDDSTEWNDFQQMYYAGVVQTPMGKKDKGEALCKAVTASLADYDNCKTTYC